MDGREPQLPFVIRPVVNNEELLRVAELRLDAFRISLGDDPTKLGDAIDLEDYATNAAVLAAFDKVTGEIIGTMRLSFSSRGPTTMQSVTTFPNDWFVGTYAEARLLCVPKGRYNRIVMIMLCKAFYLACINEGIDSMLVGARRSMEPLYRFLRFDDVSNPPLKFVPPSHTMPHRVLSLPVNEVQSRWQQAGKRETLLHLFFEQYHADLRVSDLSLNPLFGLSAPTVQGEVLEISQLVSLLR